MVIGMKKENEDERNFILGNMYRTVDQWIHPINAVKWSPNDQYLCAVGAYGTIVVYETKTWKRRFQLIGHLNNVIDCSFSSDR